MVLFESGVTNGMHQVLSESHKHWSAKRPQWLPHNASTGASMQDCTYPSTAEDSDNHCHIQNQKESDEMKTTVKLAEIS